MVLPLVLDAHPDHVGALEPVLDGLRQLDAVLLQPHRDLDLAEDEVVEDEGGHVVAGLREDRVRDRVGLHGEVHGAQHAAGVRPPPVRHPPGRRDQPELLRHVPGRGLPVTDHGEG